jgi:hypothetical protein
MAAPSIKGTAFQALAMDLAGLVRAGRIPREALEARLEAEDLRLLEDKILPGLWYPLACYRRMTELLWEIEGHRAPAYLLARGARAAERLFETGLYQQMRRGEEIRAEKRERKEGWTEFDGNLMTSLANAIFNVSRWRYRRHPEDPNVNRIEVSEAAELPEVSRLTAQGFIEYMASRLTGANVRVTSERPTPDRIVFTLRSKPGSRASSA